MTTETSNLPVLEVEAYWRHLKTFKCSACDAGTRVMRWCPVDGPFGMDGPWETHLQLPGTSAPLSTGGSHSNVVPHLPPIIRRDASTVRLLPDQPSGHCCWV